MDIVRNEVKGASCVYKTTPVESPLFRMMRISQVKVKIIHIAQDHREAGIGQPVPQIKILINTVPDIGKHIRSHKLRVGNPCSFLILLHHNFFPSGHDQSFLLQDFIKPAAIIGLQVLHTTDLRMLLQEGLTYR